MLAANCVLVTHQNKASDMFVDSFCFEKIQHIILASVRLSFNMPHNNMFALLGLYIPFLQKVLMISCGGGNG
jgi:hypothetical protein